MTQSSPPSPSTVTACLPVWGPQQSQVFPLPLYPKASDTASTWKIPCSWIKAWTNGSIQQHYWWILCLVLGRVRDIFFEAVQNRGVFEITEKVYILRIFSCSRFFWVGSETHIYLHLFLPWIWPALSNHCFELSSDILLCELADTFSCSSKWDTVSFKGFLRFFKSAMIPRALGNGYKSCISYNIS